MYKILAYSRKEREEENLYRITNNEKASYNSVCTYYQINYMEAIYGRTVSRTAYLYFKRR